MTASVQRGWGGNVEGVGLGQARAGSSETLLDITFATCVAANSLGSVCVRMTTKGERKKSQSGGIRREHNHARVELLLVDIDTAADVHNVVEILGYESALQRLKGGRRLTGTDIILLCVCRVGIFTSCKGQRRVRGGGS